ncbi:Cutinase OS=Tsukamurella paurometabola (strain ATCC 8368 / DSM / CCUG 35730 / CIP 100753 / JCM 10117 / KCTC 9821 / NBRC 16120 / NCIMB 702349 / NCTC 13040)OX=521096 GN=Tpau_1490 PE=4 SV=1 [Tsukamurella paurometabola]|uniref:Cutinase n=1 Tax=Tsukamurella paurometabola (strain ATCC 8368 / DSM 20162 / CCUG 35730 / CIP 100753 / JCM 10117 / KCTC 9821 / NBRC 16120 / NCIMB 702349 / NCTC 13040) TaxID=521096 RepID=D5UXM3_TSUPD|nr:cutinase family protein [Tsukamurella paurometabola]ADG78115.1 cutinase [Tsukamurella paurometabola DSM 20162]SUP30249.1 Cutinase [Tsukamurella paurometabola]
MSRRHFLVPVLAALLAPVAPLATAAPVTAAPSCADYTFIGAAGSGEGGLGGGMGTMVNSAAQAFAGKVRGAGKTVALRPIYYPAAPVPTGLDKVGGFLASINIGAGNTQGDVDIVVKECPSTKIVLVGYSQGASAVHRALQRMGPRPQVVAAGLIADPDRIPNDTTRYLGSAPRTPGMAQASVPVSGADPAPLPPAVGSRTISVCNTGDPVCHWTGDLMKTVSNSHSDYSGADIGNRVAAIAGV